MSDTNPEPTAPPTRAAVIQATLNRVGAALDALGTAMRLPHPSEGGRLAAVNAVLLALIRKEAYPGPGTPVDRLVNEAEAAAARWRDRLLSYSRDFEDLVRVLRHEPAALTATDSDPDWPALRAEDFGGRGAWVAGVPGGGPVVVGRWDDLAAGHPARRWLTPDANAVELGGERVVVLAHGTGRLPPGGVELDDVVRRTEAVRGEVDTHHRQAEKRQRQAAAEEAERVAADPIEQLRQKLAKLEAAQAGQPVA